MSFFGRLIGGVAPHSRWLAAMLAVVALFAVGWGVYQLIENRGDREAANAFEPFVKADIDQDKADPNKTLSDLDAFLAKYRASSLAPRAYLLKGKTLMRAGKYPEALEAYQSADKGWPRPFSYIAREGRGDALMELKRFPEAEAVFKALSDAKDDPLRAEHLWKLGLVQEAGQHPDRALVSYRSFESLHPSSPLLEKVRSRIAMLQKK
ncbi:MAG: tetratricopeptide repeat protein [Pseudomonadota bacterium]